MLFKNQIANLSVFLSNLVHILRHTQLVGGGVSQNMTLYDQEGGGGKKKGQNSMT